MPFNEKPPPSPTSKDLYDISESSETEPDSAIIDGTEPPSHLHHRHPAHQISYPAPTASPNSLERGFEDAMEMRERDFAHGQDVNGATDALPAYRYAASPRFHSRGLNSPEGEELGNYRDRYRTQSQALASEVRQIVEVRNVELARALALRKLNVHTKDSYILFAACFVAFLCSCCNGYDGTLMSAINAMIPFTHTINAGHSGSSTGLIFSSYTVGQMVGAFTAGVIADKLGRRMGMAIGAVVIMSATVLLALSEGKVQFIIGRVILGSGVAITTAAAPSYLLEICPPQWRGRMTGCYNLGWFGGAIPAGAITLGTNFISGDWSWKIPILVQAVPSAFVLGTVFLLPESPRWLYSQGRRDEAIKFLTRFHGHGDITHPLVELEIREFKERISLVGNQGKWWDYSGLYSTKSQRWRTLMVILMAVFGQYSGNGVGYFNTVVFQELGYSTVMQLALNLIVSVVQSIGATIAVCYTDHMPRRSVLIIGTFCCSLMLALEAGLSALFADQQNKPVDKQNLRVGQGAVAAYFLFWFVYSFTYSPLQALYPAECLQTNVRGKGMAAYAFFVNCISWINLYCTPIALDRLQYRYIYVFVAWDFIESILGYFLIVETQGRTLEELEDIFSAPNPVKASKIKHKIAITNDRETIILGNVD